MSFIWFLNYCDKQQTMYVIIIMCYYFAWVDISRVIDFTIAIYKSKFNFCCNTNRNINKKLQLWHVMYGIIIMNCACPPVEQALIRME